MKQAPEAEAKMSESVERTRERDLHISCSIFSNSAIPMTELDALHRQMKNLSHEVQALGWRKLELTKGKFLAMHASGSYESRVHAAHPDKQCKKNVCYPPCCSADMDAHIF